MIRSEVATVDLRRKDSAPVELRLYAAATEVGGRVAASDGRPLRGARVTLDHREIPGTTLTSATDGTGEFVLRNVPPGTYWVAARTDGYAEVRRPLTVGRSPIGDLHFSLPLGATVVGRVRLPPSQQAKSLWVSTADADRSPVEPADAGLTNTWAIVGAEGNYRLTGLAPGSYSLQLIMGNEFVDSVTVSVPQGERAQAPPLCLTPESCSR